MILSYLFKIGDIIMHEIDTLLKAAAKAQIIGPGEERKILVIAEAIANIDNVVSVKAEHFAEAIQYCYANFSIGVMQPYNYGSLGYSAYQTMEYARKAQVAILSLNNRLDRSMLDRVVKIQDELKRSTNCNTFFLKIS
jgi:hypothetical protein